MQRALPLTLLTLLFCSTLFAADTRYVSDKQFIPLRSGPGSEYRITHSGIPSATRLEVVQISESEEFAEITTEKGTNGWIRTQYLMKELPAQNQLNAAQLRLDSLSKENTSLKEKTRTLGGDRDQLSSQLTTTDSSLSSVTEELAALKQVSGKAVQLDADNRHLTLEAEELRSAAETLKAENRRLQDALDSEAFMNGSLAVLMGVFITLVVPRLWPKRKNNSGWA